MSESVFQACILSTVSYYSAGVVAKTRPKKRERSKVSSSLNPFSNIRGRPITVHNPILWDFELATTAL